MKDGKICQRIGTTTKNLKVNLMDFTVACISFVSMADQAKTCLKVGESIIFRDEVVTLKNFYRVQQWAYVSMYKYLLLLAYA